jgi:uncharacterized membrane protein
MLKSIQWYIAVSTVISSLIAFVIIFCAIVLPFLYPNSNIPPFIETWGGVIVGFYFGSFMTLLTKVVERETDKSAAAPPNPPN